MLIKGIALTALVASTPLAVFATQDPEPQRADRRSDAEHERLQNTLKRVRAELKGAQREVELLRKQLSAALDRLDSQAEPERERSCSPSRSRMLMSHYQWMREQGHRDRARVAMEKIVKRVGEDANRLNSLARDLMTDKETADKFDELALALARRMQSLASGAQKHRRRISHVHLDTIAFAHFLNGNVARAVEIQRQAIAHGGSGDDYRRRLRTYEVARAAVDEARRSAVEPATTLVASSQDEDEE